MISANQHELTSTRAQTFSRNTILEFLVLIETGKTHFLSYYFFSLKFPLKRVCFTFGKRFKFPSFRVYRIFLVFENQVFRGKKN